MKLNIAVLAGDGIGPEIIAEALKSVQAVCTKFNHELTYKEALVGACAIDATGNPYPEETHSLCMQSDAVLFGAIGSPFTTIILLLKCVRSRACLPCVRNWAFLPTSDL